MPRRRSNLNNACSIGARRKRNERDNRMPGETVQINEENRIRIVKRRTQKSQAHRNERLRQNVLRARAARQNNIDTFRAQERRRQQIRKELIGESFFRLAFEYIPDINYSAHSKIAISAMDKECQYCHALKFHNEAPGICCASGKVVLPPLTKPPEPLQTLIGATEDSKLFLRKIRKFNSCFSNDVVWSNKNS